MSWPQAREGRVRGQERVGDVAGVDTASDRLHMVWTEDGNPERRAHRRVKGSPDERRALLYDFARAQLGQLPAGCHVFCEEPLALQNGKTTRILGLAAGAIWAAHLEYDLAMERAVCRCEGRCECDDPLPRVGS